MPDTFTRRKAAIQGLMAAAQFIADHPDLPLGASDPFLCRVNPGSDKAGRAEIDRIAAILGTFAADNADGTTYRVTLHFGGGIRYSAFMIATAEVPPADLDTLAAVCEMASASIPAGAAA